MNKTKTQLKELIVTSFVDIFLLHNPSYNSKFFLKKLKYEVRQRLNLKSGIKQLVVILEEYSKNPVNGKDELKNISNLLFFIDLYKEM